MSHVVPGGVGGLLGTVAPLALNFAFPGLGAALGGALDIGTTAGSGLLGAGVGALSSGLTGGNALTGAITGGLGGAIAPNLGDIGDSIGSGLDSAESALGGTGSFGNDLGINDLFGSSSPTSSGFISGANGSPLGSTSSGSGSLASVTGTGGTGLGIGGGGGGASAFAPSTGSNFGDIGQGFNQATSGFGNGVIGNPTNPGVEGAFTQGGGYSLPANSAMSGWTGMPSVGAGITSAAPSTGGLGSSLSNGISNLYNGSALQSGVNDVSNGISDAYHGLGFGNSSGLEAGGALPNASTGSNFWNTATSGGILGNNSGGLLGGKMGNNFQLGDLLGGINSYMAQNNIADAQKQGFQNAQGYLQPYLNTGTAANTQLGNLLGLNGAAAGQTAQANVLSNDPGYQFRLQQGQLGIDRSLNAQGLSNSGAAVKAANDYAQGSASQEYQNAIQNLMGQSNAGQQAAGQIGNYANLSGQANAAALGQQSNVINQGLGGLFGTGQNQLAQLLTRSIFGGY